MGGKNARQKFNDRIKFIPLKPIMPKEYNSKKREELKKFEHSIMKAANNNIGKEPGE